MGIFLNPSKKGFALSLNSQIYVDKSGLIAELNSVLETEQRFVCISRPRRFGKTMAANMISAYYCRAYDSHELFSGLKIESHQSFEKHINKYNVIMLNMNHFLNEVRFESDGSARIRKFISLVKKSILEDIREEIPDAPFSETTIFAVALQKTADYTGMPFIIIIDEWDCIFREFRDSTDGQEQYLDFLSNMLKDRQYVSLAYMTGILPIKKYGSHSDLGMFSEFTAAQPRQYGEYLGFTLEEARSVCEAAGMPFDEISDWYNGYLAEDVGQVFNPRSVVEACLSRKCLSYWTRTERYEALRDYIVLNHDGLRDTVTMLLAGAKERVNINHFSNDMTTLKNKGDVLALLVHLGCLGYDSAAAEVFMPNREISMEFVTAMEDGGWDEVLRSLGHSRECLEVTWRGDSDAVAGYVEAAHRETSHLAYNDENALSCTISLAYYSAREYYKVFRELPAGDGFADMVFLPKQSSGKPAVIIELKWDKSPVTAMNQIKRKNYPDVLKGYSGKALLVGISYGKKDKRHECVIEEVTIGQQ